MFCELTWIFKRDKLKSRYITVMTGKLVHYLISWKLDMLKMSFIIEMKTIFTIHNLMYQGKHQNVHLKEIGIVLLKIYVLRIRNGTCKYGYYSKWGIMWIKYPYFSEGLEWMTNYRNVYGVLKWDWCRIFWSCYDPDIAVNSALKIMIL